jgi:sec-independent protein translocase protein TatA
MELLILLGSFGAQELIPIILAIIILFGGKKIPELMKGIGEGIKEFKKASRLDDDPKNIEK